MRGLHYKKIDAFTGETSLGNPAGVVYLPQAEELTEEQMQAIARQEKGVVSEVVFCTPVDKGFYNLKYYSSECEVEFCGHATIACMYDLIKNDLNLAEIKTVTIRTNKGELPVINDLENSDSVFITAPVPEYNPCHLSIQDIAPNLAIVLDGIDRDLPVRAINGGLNTLIVPIRSFDLIMDMKPDCLTLESFCNNSNIDIILVFSSEVFDNTNLYRTRVFAPKYGYLEDPATGSGNAAFGYYLLDRRLWDGSNIIALEQGPSRDNPNVVKLGTRILDGVQQVMFGGKATVQYEKEI